MIVLISTKNDGSPAASIQLYEEAEDFHVLCGARAKLSHDDVCELVREEYGQCSRECTCTFVNICIEAPSLMNA